MTLASGAAVPASVIVPLMRPPTASVKSTPVGVLPPGEKAQRGSAIYFQVADIHAVHSTLRANGVAFRADPFIVNRTPKSEHWLAEFTDETTQAYLLLHVFLHELGHHHDRMTSPGRRDFTRGERYAEEYALRYEKRIWSDYCRAFRICLD